MSRRKGHDGLAFSYNPLWKQLIDKGLSKHELKLAASISPATLTRMNKGQFVNLEALDKICQVLQCRIEDVIEYVPEE